MRKIGRKSLSVLLALLLVIGCFSGMCPVSAAGSADLKIYQDTIYYTVSAMQEVTIKSARSAVTEAVIPAELDGCPVTEIGEYAFKDCTRLKRVVLPDTIRRIGEFAFKDCSRLTELSIPDTVSEIGWGIVQGTSWLENQTSDFVSAGQGILLAYTGTEKDVTVPDTVRAVGGYAFDGCTTVETVQLPSSLRSIDAFAFSNCINLRQVQITDGLESIGEYAFHWCVSLEQIELPVAAESASFAGNDTDQQHSVSGVQQSDGDRASRKHQNDLQLCLRRLCRTAKDRAAGSSGGDRSQCLFRLRQSGTAGDPQSGVPYL